MYIYVPAFYIVNYNYDMHIKSTSAYSDKNLQLKYYNMFKNIKVLLTVGLVTLRAGLFVFI